jgi:hypothetical protein
MLHDSRAEIVSFERFLERRQQLAHTVPPDNHVPPVSTDPGNSSRRERDPRTTRTTAVACQVKAVTGGEAFNAQR